MILYPQKRYCVLYLIYTREIYMYPLKRMIKTNITRESALFDIAYLRANYQFYSFSILL